MRARETASERLDGEVSEIEAARLDAHLRGCADCREFASSLAFVVTEIRAAPLERPATITFEPGRRHVRALRMHGTAAAVAVALAATSIVLGHVHLGTTSSAPHATPANGSAANASTARSAELQRQLLAMLPAADRWRAELQSGPIPAL